MGVRVEPSQLQPHGQVTFLFSARLAWNQTVSIFSVTQWQGEPQESEEMRPAWFPLSALPVERMWADAAPWLPQVLAGQSVQLEFVYADDGQTLASVTAL